MKRRSLGAAALGLLAWAAASAQSRHAGPEPGAAPRDSGIELNLLARFTVPEDIDAAALRTSIVYDGNWIYLSLPRTVLRGMWPLGPKSYLQPVFRPAAAAINRLYVYDHVLYVLTRPREDSPDATLYGSADHGRSFVAVDFGLRECADGRCAYLESTQLLARNGLLYVNAGGGRNLLVSADRGATYAALSGEVASIACYQGTFALIGQVALLGGECGLDMPYLERGILSADGLHVVTAFRPVRSPPLSNRKINVIASDPGTPLVLATAEGAVLRSVDEGRSFQYALRFSAEGGPYPYMNQILFPSNRPNLVLIAGFDKSTFRPYLACGTRYGRHWTDISYLLATSGDNAVSGLAEGPDGQLLVATADQADRRISIRELKFPR